MLPKIFTTTETLFEYELIKHFEKENPSNESQIENRNVAKLKLLQNVPGKYSRIMMLRKIKSPKILIRNSFSLKNILILKILRR